MVPKCSVELPVPLPVSVRTPLALTVVSSARALSTTNSPPPFKVAKKSLARGPTSKMKPPVATVALSLSPSNGPVGPLPIPQSTKVPLLTVLLRASPLNTTWVPPLLIVVLRAHPE